MLAILQIRPLLGCDIGCVPSYHVSLEAPTVGQTFLSVVAAGWKARTKETYS